MSTQDSVYKNLFTQPEVLESLLRFYGPSDLADMLDFKSLEDVGSDLLGEKGQKRQSDLIFKIRFHDRRYMYLVLLLEIQGSQYQETVVLRMLEYVTLIWKKLLVRDKKLKKLPPVLPILLHTGDRPFRKPTQLKQILAPHPSFLEKFQPHFEFFLVDECLLVDQAKHRIDPTSILISSNQARDLNDFNLALQHIDKLASNHELKYLARQLLRWLLKVSKKELPEIAMSPEDIEVENLKENLVMLQDNLRKMRHLEYEKGVIFGRNEGLEQGIETGISKGIETGKQVGQIEGALEVLYQLYSDGDVSLEKTRQRMQLLLGQGLDETVQAYLKRLVINGEI